MKNPGLEYVEGIVDNKSNEPNSRFDVKTKGLTSSSSSSVGKIRIEGAADMPLLALAIDGMIKIDSLSWFVEFI